VGGVSLELGRPDMVGRVIARGLGGSERSERCEGFNVESGRVGELSKAACFSNGAAQICETRSEIWGDKEREQRAASATAPNVQLTHSSAREAGGPSSPSSQG
jgi:hypothetical protein